MKMTRILRSFAQSMKWKSLLKLGGVGMVVSGAMFTVPGDAASKRAAYPQPVKVAVIVRTFSGSEGLAKDQVVKVLELSGFFEESPANANEKLLYKTVNLNDNQSPDNAKAVAASLLRDRYSAFIGIMSSSQAQGVSQAIAESSRGKAPVPYIGAIETSDSLNTGYFHRTTTSSSRWGRNAAVRSQDLPIISAPQLAYIRRVSEASLSGSLTEDGFGKDAKAGWDEFFGNASLDVLMNNTGTEYLINGTIYSSGNLNTSVLGSGTWLIGATLATQNANNVVTSLAALPNDVWLSMTGTVDAVAYSAANIAWLNANAIGVVPHYWEGSPAYDSWVSWSLTNLGMVPASHFALRAFDAAVLMAAGLIHGRTAGETHLLIDRFSKPSGQSENLLPGDFLNALHKRIDVERFNFEGASGSVDMENGECKVIIFKIWIGPGTGSTFEG